MTFDFDTVVPRRGSGSYKWDSADDQDYLPMWVADMDFRTAPPVIRALENRVQHGVFGYTKVPESYYAATCQWSLKRHHFEIEREWILYTSGVVPAVSAIIRAITQPGDKVIIQTPVYNCFFSSIRNMGCQIIENPLLCHNNHYEMNFSDLEQKAAEPGVKALLLCNPHNPVGRAWTKQELQRLGDICQKQGIIVISDEIHCDLVHPGQQHQPFASLGNNFLFNSVTCTSPSKSFNIAGLQIANIVIADEVLRQKIDKALNIHEVCDVNPFGVTALIAAYTEGSEWLDELRNYLYENYLLVSDFLAKELPALGFTKQEATYLAWIDCRALNLTSDQIADLLAMKEHLQISSGTTYGNAGDGYIRLNMACPRKQLIDGLNRLKRALG